MVHWRRGYICPRYMCIFRYVKLIWCSGVPEIYGRLEERGYLIFVCTSSENISSFRVWVLHHRGLFYERPTGGNAELTAVPDVEIMKSFDLQCYASTDIITDLFDFSLDSTTITNTSSGK